MKPIQPTNSLLLKTRPTQKNHLCRVTQRQLTFFLFFQKLQKMKNITVKAGNLDPNCQNSKINKKS